MIWWWLTGTSGAALVAAAGVRLTTSSARRQRQREAESIAATATPVELEVTGSIVVQESDATPDAGRGAIKLSQRGLMWQLPGRLRTGGSVPWRHVESVARRDVFVRVVWGASHGRTTLQYRGQGAARIEGMARRHLTAPAWQIDQIRNGERWDSSWSRRT